VEGYYCGGVGGETEKIPIRSKTVRGIGNSLFICVKCDLTTSVAFLLMFFVSLAPE